MKNFLVGSYLGDRESSRREDLWLFPYYRDSSQVPYDAQAGGPAEADWPEVPFKWGRWFLSWGWMIPVGLLASVILFNTWKKFCVHMHSKQLRIF